MHMGLWRWGWLVAAGLVLISSRASAQTTPTNPTPAPADPKPDPATPAPAPASSKPAQATPAASTAQDVPKDLQDKRTFVSGLRAQDSYSPNDQTNLREWIKAELAHWGKGLDPAAPEFMSNLAEAFKQFRSSIQKQVADPGNKPGFALQVILAVSAVSAELLPKDDLTLFQGIALSRILLDAGKLEALPGLKAGLGSKYMAVRYYSAEGIKVLVPELITGGQLGDAVAALKAAGAKEGSDSARQMMYRALAIPNRIGDVFDAMLAILDARLDLLRKGGAKVGSDASVVLFYLAGESERLNPQQAEAIVKRTAVLTRLCAEQYAATAIRPFEDEVALELTLVQAEALLEKITRKSGGIRKVLEEQGAAGKPKVLEAARDWYGTSDKPGMLSGDPWKVEAGAP